LKNKTNIAVLDYDCQQKNKGEKVRNIKGFFAFFAEHSCSIMASLFKNLSGALRTRLVQKFVEGDHIKIDRLMELHFKYHKKVQDCDEKIERTREVIMVISICSALFHRKPQAMDSFKMANLLNEIFFL
jgi:hypothetical protein